MGGIKSLAFEFYFPVEKFANPMAPARVTIHKEYIRSRYCGLYAIEFDV